MNQRSDLNSRGSNKICEVYMYVINCMGGSEIVGKNWWVRPKTKGTVYCQMGRSTPVYIN